LLIDVIKLQFALGPAELVDTPEGYEPKHWEYYKVCNMFDAGKHLLA